MAANGDIYANLSVPKMDFHEISALAEEFVLQYYTVMNKCPELLHRFYADDSVVIYESPPVFGQQKIYNIFMELNLKDTRVLIHKIDALRANKNSVLIQVCGEICIAGAEPRRFMRSFTLCEKLRSDFYVLNDIFRYQDRVYKPEVTEHIIDEAHISEVKEIDPVVESLPKVHKSNGDQAHEQTWQPQPPVVHEPEPPIKMESEPVIQEPVPPTPEPVREPEHKPEPIREPVRTPSPVQPIITTGMSWAQRASGNQSGPAPARVAHNVRQVNSNEQQTTVHVRNAPAPRGNPSSNASRPQRGGRPQQMDSTGNTGDTHDQNLRGASGVGRPGGAPRSNRGGPRTGPPRGAGISAAPGSGAPRRGAK